MSADSQRPMQQALTLLAAAGASIAAIVLSFAARLEGDVGALRLASGLLVYGAVVLPVGVLRAEDAGRIWLLVALLCLAATVFLFVLALLRRGEPAYAWPAAAVAVALSLFYAASAGVWPVLLPSGSALHSAYRVVLAGWGLVALALLVRGVRQHSALLRRTGVGVGVLVGAHLAQAGPGISGEPFLAGSGLRLLGIIVVLGGVAPYALSTLALQRARDRAATTELLASRAAEREAAERRHEMRNAILGLSGAAHLLSSASADRELTEAVRSELARLQDLLDGPSAPPPPGADAGYAVRPVLRSLVTLYAGGGADIEFDVPADLRAAGSGLALSQTMVNLLMNCSRHAPGSPVRVRARSLAGRIRVEVTDHGPGVEPGTEAFAVTHGWRGSRSEGSGLGLSISRQAIQAHGGDLWLEPNADATSGCTAVVSLPELSPQPAPVSAIPVQAPWAYPRIRLEAG